MKPILDACCGSRMFWFDKENPNVEFCDNRVVPYHEYYKGRYIEIKPDTVCDFTALPFPDKSFKLVVFDPPHLTWAGKTSWMALKYGCLDENWPKMIHDGFHECMRVLDDYGTLIFKWSEVQIPLKDVLKAIGEEPLFGHRSGKHNNTHWMAFMKERSCQGMKKWNFSKHIYENYTVPTTWHTPLIAELDEIINCADCGKQITYGDCYTSLTIHTNTGMGYPVCEKCYEKEWEERRAVKDE